jgi:hypothetical protein
MDEARRPAMKKELVSWGIAMGAGRGRLPIFMSYSTDTKVE